jgi:hypothetical protein
MSTKSTTTADTYVRRRIASHILAAMVAQAPKCFSPDVDPAPDLIAYRRRAANLALALAQSLIDADEAQS